jgi:transcriptional regulator with XRE-family HTH domain
MREASPIRPARLAEKILQIRLCLGLSQNEMLERLGFSEQLFRSNISQYEIGTRFPPLGVLLRYAQVAGVWLDVLVDYGLQLPSKLPCVPKHEGIKHVTSARPRRNKG